MMFFIADVLPAAFLTTICPLGQKKDYYYNFYE